MTKTLASQIRATLGVLFKIYSYIRALQMRFKKKDNTNPSGQRVKNSGGQLDYCVAN